MSRAVPRALAIVLACCVWLALAPARVGGAANYVKVSGASMNPTFHTGDMILLHRSSNYHVGDIIAYHSQLLGGAIIIHRIIDVTNDDRYVTKGDNNDFIDAYTPRVSDVLGRRVAKLPGASQISTITKSPFGIAALVVLAGAVVLMGRAPRGGHRRRRAVRG